MNRKAGRRHLSIVVVATSLAVASACSSQSGSASTPDAGAHPSASAAGPAAGGPPSTAPIEIAGKLSLSDGHADVTAGGTNIHLATTVTDASWSPDGSRIAYVDSHGNIATARSDGSDVRVLTKTDATVKRAQPTWTNGAEVMFSERAKNGVWRLKSVVAGTPALGDITTPEGDFGFDNSGHDRAPTSAFIRPDGANDGVDVLAYEHDATKGPQVWIVDRNQRSPEAKELVAGSDPALSADGSELAYVGKNGQLYVTSVAKASAASSRQITFGIKGITRPAWSFDGTRIAFGTPTDVESVSTKLAAGVTTNPSTVESTKAGVPAYVPVARDEVVRFTGDDPIADSIAVSKRLWNLHNVKVNVQSQADLTIPSEVTLVSTADPTSLANIADVMGNGPVLFTDGKTLDPTTAAEIKRALGTSGQGGPQLSVRLFGATGVIAAPIEQSVKALGYSVSRIKAAAPRMSSATYLIASDTDQAVLGNLGHLSRDFTVIRVHGSSLSSAQKALIRAEDSQPVTVYTAGSAARTAVQASWSGKPKIKIIPVSTVDESVALASHYHSGVAFVTAGDWKGMVLAAQFASEDTVMVVDKGATLTPGVTAWLEANGPTLAEVYPFGNITTMPVALVDSAAAAVSGPAGSIVDPT